MTLPDTPGEALDPKALEAFRNVFFKHKHRLPDRDVAKAAIRAYLDASVIGSDTAGLPSNCAGLVELLKPFARQADEFHSDWPDKMVPVCGIPEGDPEDEDSATFTLGDLRRAREAIAALSDTCLDGRAEPEVDFEVWQGDEFLSSTSDFNDALHYVSMYSQDGPVQLIKATTYREPIPARPKAGSDPDEK